MFDKIDDLSINTIRTLSMDMIQKANSGHPGLPLGAAPMAYVLWSKYLNVNPKTSTNWINRDRFVLSAGHGSALLYCLLHLSGYKVSIDDLKQFRQWNSITPGHPEVNHTDGVEATTGPLGQGIAMAVGMAMAETHLSAKYKSLINHHTYVICGDGDLMEGVSQEASSLAGHLKLNKLIVMYDSNDISLDGPTNKAFTEDVKGRYEAYGWQHILVKDGNDLDAIDEAIALARASKDKPTIIEVKTVIGFGSEHAGTNKVHGAPLGAEGIKFAKKNYKWEFEDFEVPNEVYDRFNETLGKRGSTLEAEWNNTLNNMDDEIVKSFNNAINGVLPEDWTSRLPNYDIDNNQATRVTSKEIIQTLSNVIPYFWGGSADLSSSNNTMVTNETDYSPVNYGGRNIWFGVREFAMASMLNGIALHKGSKVYGGTFFVFSDYLRPAVRLSALQKLPVTYVLTHDSVAVGEDGPTHEPVEHLSAFRSMPNLNMIRPCDANETKSAWQIAIESEETPTMLVLSRQNLPVLDVTLDNNIDQVRKGGYIISRAQKETPDGLLIATGSEVHLAVLAQEKLRKQSIDVSVISLPSMYMFEQQDCDYKSSVIPPSVENRITIEAGSSFGWDRYAGPKGKMISIEDFGYSAPGNLVLEKLGFTVDNIVNEYLKLK
ncbi:transketolase [Macrococcus animalis]|uniref:transketolase n=1 Tax=Macrococcus animalis TaxID=3395467 RepID=UPI0039BE4293